MALRDNHSDSYCRGCFFAKTNLLQESQTTVGMNNTDSTNSSFELRSVEASPLAALSETSLLTTFSDNEPGERMKTLPPSEASSPHNVTLPAFPATGPSTEIPYQPSAEELRHFYDLKTKVFLQGMTMHQFLMLDEFRTLSEPMQLRMVKEVIQMANDRQLDGRQFIQGQPPSGTHDPGTTSKSVPGQTVTVTREQNRQHFLEHRDRSSEFHYK